VKINTEILQVIGITLISACLIAGGLIWLAKTTHAQEVTIPYSYEIVTQSQGPILEPEQSGVLAITLKNTGSADWALSELALTGIYFDGTAGRPSIFATKAWIDQTKILPNGTTDPDVIHPRGSVNFYIPIQTTAMRKALYQEDFALQIGTITATGTPIKWLVQVGNEMSYQVDLGKQIKLWLDTQTLWAIENGVVIMEAPVSSGKAGYGTPKGTYTIFNHKDVGYSSKYRLWMDYWMALQDSYGEVIGYGLHALPHWKTKQTKYADGSIVDGRLYQDGKVYEDINHLGERMSHGCVRLGLVTSRILYNWAPNKTPVIIA